MNVTLVFSSYGSPGALTHAVFFLALLVYLATVCANLTLMLVICMDAALHKPMYIFLFHLAINGVMGSSAVLPKIMENLLSEAQNMPYVHCLVQVFFINVYGTCAYAILTLMAYDRYVSICRPLQYHSVMTAARTRLLLLLAYLVPVCLLGLQVFLTSTLPLCRFSISKLFCDNLAVVNLSCVRSPWGDAYGLGLVLVFVVLPLVLVVSSYVQILLVSLKASPGAQRKALRTCTPHLITFINFSLASLFSVIYNRFNAALSRELNVFMSVHFIMVPPLLHPLIYGIRTREISGSLRKILQRRELQLHTCT